VTADRPYSLHLFVLLQAAAHTMQRAHPYFIVQTRPGAPGSLSRLEVDFGVCGEAERGEGTKAQRQIQVQSRPWSVQYRGT
jgi:hypothetical protein